MKAHFLPVHVDATRVLQLEFLIEAAITFTPDRCRVLVLLLDALVDLLALGAAESTDL